MWKVYAAWCTELCKQSPSCFPSRGAVSNPVSHLRVPAASHPHQHLELSGHLVSISLSHCLSLSLFITFLSVRCVMVFSVVLICISLAVNDTEHLYYVFSICLLQWMICLDIFTHFRAKDSLFSYFFLIAFLLCSG